MRIPQSQSANLATGARIDYAPQKSALLTALALTSGAAQQIGQKIQDEQDHDALVEAQALYTKEIISWTGQVETGRTGKAAFGVTKDFEKEHGRLVKHVSGNLSPRAAKAFKNWAMDRELAGSQKMASFEHAQHQAHAKDVHVLRLQSVFEAAEQSPSDFQDAYKQLDESFALAVGQGLYRPEEAQAKLYEAKQGLSTSVFENMYAQNRGEAMKSMDALGFSPADKARAQKRLQADLRQEKILAEAGKSAARASLVMREHDIVAAYRDGVEAPMPEFKEYVQAFGEAEGTKRYEALQAEQDLGRDVRAIKAMSASEQEALLAENDPAKAGEAKEGYALLAQKRDALTKVIAHDRTLRATDPAGYVISSDPSVQEAYKQMVAGGDARAYIAAVQGAFEARGMSGDILPKAYTEAVGESFLKADAKSSAEIMIGLQTQWGKAWPQVFAEISKSKESLPPVAYVMGAGMRENPATLLGEVVKNPEFEKQAGEIMGKDNLKSLDTAVEESLQPLTATLAEQGGTEVASTVKKATRQLAMRYAMNGLDPKKAAQKAANDVAMERYTFNGTYRVPKGVDSDKVEAGLEIFFEEVKPDFFQPAGGFAWQSAEEVAEQTHKLIKDQARWVTAPDEAGLMLFRGPFAVLDAKGEVVKLDWQELQKLGDGVKAAENYFGE